MLEVISIIENIGNSYKYAKEIYDILGLILSIIVIHKTFYWIIGLLFTRKFKHTKNYHKYAIMIAARNEENVIGNLIDSIKRQDYDQNLLTIFVVADNCTDNTAKIVRDKGCICYERFDDVNKTKGFALQYLVKNIEKDYGVKNFEGYFVFDADNLLKKDYIARMNDAFEEGAKIITSYRNTKNFDENWVSSTYALHWIRSIRSNHRARSVLHLATNIQGTGFLFANELIKDGWNYTSITEDRAMTADAVSMGYEITYNDEAEFYDEQPTSLKIALRQRLRWSKGHLLAFIESGPKLFANIFIGKLLIKDKEKKPKKNFKDYLNAIIESIRHRFASFDTLVQLTPTSVINIVRFLICYVIIFSCYRYSHGINNLNFFAGDTLLAKFINNFINWRITIEPGMNALLISMIVVLWSRIFYRIGKYIENIWMAIYLFIVEDSRIKKIPLRKKILYIFTWPTFDIIGRYTTYLALFTKVTWKPIPHESKVTIKDIEGGN